MKGYVITVPSTEEYFVRGDMVSAVSLVNELRDKCLNASLFAVEDVHTYTDDLEHAGFTTGE